MVINVSSTPELERRVEERLKSGLYTFASELVREALRLFFQYEAARARQIEMLDQRIRKGSRSSIAARAFLAPRRVAAAVALAARASDPKAAGRDLAG